MLGALCMCYKMIKLPWKYIKSNFAFLKMYVGILPYIVVIDFYLSKN